MKQLLLISTTIFIFSSCASLAKTATKYWTKKQIKEFVNKCEQKSARLVSEEKARHYCNCAVDKVAEQYHNYEDTKKIGIIEVLKIAKDCKK